jgi:predicted lipoprotein with Yx(FWY)xxD motif
MKLHLATALSWAVLAPFAAAQTADAPISTSNNAEEGEYLVDGAGLSLYLFKADTQGRNGQRPASACNEGPCIGTWPPLLSDTPMGDDKIDASMLGTMAREDGTMQVTYNGWPLYYYYEDYVAGDITGDDIESFGEDWYLIGPHGYRPGKDADDE